MSLLKYEDLLASKIPGVLSLEMSEQAIVAKTAQKEIEITSDMETVPSIETITGLIKACAQPSNRNCLSKWRSHFLLAAMKEISGQQNTTPDPSHTNQQNETVFAFAIHDKGERIGQIEYLEDDSKVTILRSDIEESHQNKGKGLQAYIALIERKLSEGKEIGSDAILFPQAIRVYEKLSEAGYPVKRADTRNLIRGRITTISSESILEQRKSFPVVYKDGVGMTAPGYRLKGEPVFSIAPGPVLQSRPHLRVVEKDMASDKVVIYQTNGAILVREQGDCLQILNIDQLTDMLSKANQYQNEAEFI